jgi:hypothetical protein
VGYSDKHFEEMSINSYSESRELVKIVCMLFTWGQMGVTQGDSDFRSGSHGWTGQQFYNTKGEQIYLEHKK